MKNLLFLLTLSIFAIAGCGKDEETTVDAKGSLTAKFSFLDAATNKWSAVENYTAVTTVTTKTGNEYKIIATDASGNVFTLYGTSVTGTGKFSARGIYVKGSKTYSSSSGFITVSATTSNSIAATFITEGSDWSMYDGSVNGTF